MLCLHWSAEISCRWSPQWWVIYCCPYDFSKSGVQPLGGGSNPQHAAFTPPNLPDIWKCVKALWQSQLAFAINWKRSRPDLFNGWRIWGDVLDTCSHQAVLSEPRWMPGSVAAAAGCHSDATDYHGCKYKACEECLPILLGCEKDLLLSPHWCRMLSASESPYCLGRPIGDARLPMKSWHNNLFELQTVFLALRHFEPLILSRHGLVRTSGSALLPCWSWLGHKLRKTSKRTAFTQWKPYECCVKTCSPVSIIFLPIRSLEGWN